jgi:hypothetical protein
MTKNNDPTLELQRYNLKWNRTLADGYPKIGDIVGWSADLTFKVVEVTNLAIKENRTLGLSFNTCDIVGVLHHSSGKLAASTLVLAVKGGLYVGPITEEKT